MFVWLCSSRCDYTEAKLFELHCSSSKFLLARRFDSEFGCSPIFCSSLSFINFVCFGVKTDSPIRFLYRIWDLSRILQDIKQFILFPSFYSQCFIFRFNCCVLRLWVGGWITLEQEAAGICIVFTRKRPHDEWRRNIIKKRHIFLLPLFSKRRKYIFNKNVSAQEEKKSREEFCNSHDRDENACCIDRGPFARCRCWLTRCSSRWVGNKTKG